MSDTVTEANIERDFSDSGETLSARRTRLAPLLLSALMIVGENIRKLGVVKIRNIKFHSGSYTMARSSVISDCKRITL